MSTQYPNSIDSYTVHQDNSGEYIASSVANNLQDAVVAIENRLGVVGLTSLPTVGASGQMCVVNKQWFVSDGSQWNQMSQKYINSNTQPSTANPGDAWYNTSTNKLLYHDNAGWVDPTTASFYAPTGLTGATTATRYVGATTSGPPASGTFNAGDYIVSVSDGSMYVCMTGGSPGTWGRTSPHIAEQTISLWKNSSTTVNTSSGSSVFLQEGTTATSSTATTSAKLHLLNPNWSIHNTYAFEAYLYSSSSSGQANAALYDIDGGAIINNSMIHTTVMSGSAVRLRSGSFSLNTNHYYGVVIWSSNASYYTYVTDASLIVFPATVGG